MFFQVISRQVTLGEGVALWAQLTVSRRQDTVQREVRNAKPCLPPGNSVQPHLNQVRLSL